MTVGFLAGLLAMTVSVVGVSAQQASAAGAAVPSISMSGTIPGSAGGGPIIQGAVNQYFSGPPGAVLVQGRVTSNSDPRPTGTAVFSIDGASCVIEISAANLGGGSCLLVPPTVGARTLTLTYAGDANYAAGMTSTPVAVHPATSFGLVSPPAGSRVSYDTPFTASAQVANFQGMQPTGTVVFSGDFGGATCTATAEPGPSYTSFSCSLTEASGGYTGLRSNYVYASYSGDAWFAPVFTGRRHDIGRSDPIVQITSDSPDPSLVGTSVTVSGTVSGVQPQWVGDAIASPSGTVSVTGTGGAGCTATVAGGSWSCAMTMNAYGSGTIAANYSGDAYYQGTLSGYNSGSAAHTVNRWTTTTAVTASPSPATFGVSVTLTATVSPSGVSAATGTVTFKDGVTTLGTGTLSNGVATLSLQTLGGGAHTITASYGGDSTYDVSSGSAALTVNPATTTVTLAVDPNPALSFLPVTLTATVVPAAATGTIAFYDGIEVLASVTIVDGAAQFTTTEFSVGDHTLSAVYAGSADHAGDTSDPVSLQNDENQHPVLSLPADITAEATSANGAQVTFSAIVTHAKFGPATVSCVPASATVFALGTTTVTCTATDAEDHVTVGSFSVTVSDTTRPVLTLPSTIYEETAGDGTVAVAVTYSVTATDAVSATAASCLPISGTSFPIGATTVSCTATDAAGNEATGSFTVYVSAARTYLEITANPSRPVLGQAVTLSARLLLESTGEPAYGFGLVTFSLAFGSEFCTAFIFPWEPAATCTLDPPWSPLAVGSNWIFASFPENAAAGLTEAFGGIDLVVDPDTTAPVLTVPADIVAEATGPLGASVPFTVSVTDDVGVASQSCAPASGATFALGVTTVTCTATDAVSNSASSTFKVTVSDTTRPVVAAPAHIQVVTDPGLATAVVANLALGSASATDVVGVAADDRTGVPVGNVFPLGATIVTYAATDAAGNEGVAWQTVTVRDAEVPGITVPAGIAAEATGPDGVPVVFAVSAADNVGIASQSCSPASGATFPIGATTVTCIATDAANNSTSETFTVTVSDTTEPVLSVPTNIIAEATGADGAAVSFAATAADAVGATVSCVPAPGAVFPIGTTVVSCTATDAAAHSAAATFTVTVRDTFKPVLSVPADIIAEATGADGAAVSFAATATDAVGATVSCDAVSAAVFPIGTTVVTCTATDAATNSTSASFTVGVGAVTPVGTDTTVIPLDSATGTQPLALTFGEVTAAGQTTLTTGPVGPEPPAGYGGVILGGIYYEIATTAVYSGPITVCISAPGITSHSRVLHFEGGAWVDQTVSVSVAPPQICATVSSLSPFAITSDLTAPEAVVAFDPVTQTLTVNGRDSGSGVAGGPSSPWCLPAAEDSDAGHDVGADDEDAAVQLCKYTIRDRAGNRATVEIRIKQSVQQITASAVSIAYGTAPTQGLPANLITFVWVVDAAGAVVDLDQQMTIGDDDSRIELQSKYRDGETETIRLDANHDETHTASHGLTLLRLATTQGALAVTG